MNRAVWQHSLDPWVRSETWNSGLSEDEARFQEGVLRAVGSGQSIVDASIFKSAIVALAKRHGRELPSDEDLHQRFVQAVGMSDISYL